MCATLMLNTDLSQMNFKFFGGGPLPVTTPP